MQAGQFLLSRQFMKHTIIRIVAVLITFFATVFITESLINKDSADMTTDMSQAVLPVVSIEYNGIEVNPMFGYVNDMDLSFMRSSITPLMSGRKVHLKIDTYSSTVSSISYEVRTVDGNRLIEQTVVSDYETNGRNIEANLTLKDLINSNVEYELIVILKLGNGKEVKYYTRVISPQDYYVNDKLEYISDFNKKTFDKEEAKTLTKYLESNYLGDNTTFGNVDIHSKLDQVTWGNLNPIVIDEPKITIKELSSLTGSFLVDYYVSVDDENGLKHFKIQEFYRIRYSKERIYLLDFNRTMDEVFVDEKDTYDENAIRLGILSQSPHMVESEDGSSIVFVMNNRLYSYDVKDNRIAFLFGFYDVFTEDLRAVNPNHKIKVMDVDETGNVTFLVYGYMNRGSHEGESGICAYYYDATVNTIEELAYMPSEHSPDLLMKEVDELSYMNSQGNLYLVVGRRLYSINTKTRNTEVLAENLADGSYVISNNNHMAAYLTSEDIYNAHELILMNLETQLSSKIECKGNEVISPISFIGEDLVYGIGYESDITNDRTGNTIIPMYEVNIRNQHKGIMMRYSQDRFYVVGGEVHQNQIILHRVKKIDEGKFEEALDDQIMNSEDPTLTKNIISSENNEKYEKILKISVKGTIDSSKTKHMTPKMVLYEGSREIELLENSKKYIVYGKYGVDSFYDNAATAVEKAYSISGVVMNDTGRYIYKKVSRSPKNQIMAIKEKAASENISPLAVCLNVMLENEDVIRNSQYMLNQGNSVVEILSAMPDYDILDLTGCSIDMILYYVNQDIPVLSMLDNQNAVLIIGFNDTEIVIMDPLNNEIYKRPVEDVVDWFEDNGNCFITYVRSVEE